MPGTAILIASVIQKQGTDERVSGRENDRADRPTPDARLGWAAFDLGDIG